MQNIPGSNGYDPHLYNKAGNEQWEDISLDEVPLNDHPGTPDPNIPNKGTLDGSASRTRSASGGVFGTHSASEQQVIITRITTKRTVVETQTQSPTSENHDWKETQPAATKAIWKSQRINKTHRRVLTNENGVKFRQLAQGKAKRILTINPVAGQHRTQDVSKHRAENVWIIPVKTALDSKNKEIEREIRVKTNIKESLSLPSNVEYTEHLSLDMEKVKTKGEKIQSGKTYSQAKAKEDLETSIRNKDLPLETRCAFGGHVIKGMAGLHRAAHTYNDSKPNNYLVFEKNGKLIIKASDFGKAKKITNGEADYTGNIRFVGPEGKSSRKNDVYGTALVLIRVFEELYLDENNDMLCSIEEGDRDVPLEGNKMRGVEKYVIEHKAFPATQNHGWLGFLRVIWRRISKLGKLNKTELEAHENTIHKYINELGNRMKKDSRFHHSDKLIKLLKEMTSSAPGQRPNMATVDQRYREWQKLENLPY